MFHKKSLFVIPVLALLFFASTNLAGELLIIASDLSGNWSDGCWCSHSSGHRGPLRARFRKIDDMHYRVIFRGRFARIIPFRYSVTLNVTGYQGEKLLLSGSSRLLFFGTFHYSAEATCHEFIATYHSQDDYGVFVLSR